MTSFHPENPEEPYTRMQERMRPGEHLLWAGRPDPALRVGDFGGLLFAVVWTAFSVFWESQVISMDGPLIMRLWGLPFIALGLWMLVGRPIQATRRRRRTIYAVTDQRVIEAIGTTKFTEATLTTSLDATRSRDGRRVTVTLGQHRVANSNRTRADLVLREVPDPDRVLAALDRARTPSSR